MALRREKTTYTPGLIPTPFRASRAETISLQLDKSFSLGVFSFIDPAELGVAARIHVNFHKALLYKLHAIDRFLMPFLFSGNLRCHGYPPLSLVLISRTTWSDVPPHYQVRTAKPLANGFERKGDIASTIRRDTDLRKARLYGQLGPDAAAGQSMDK
jgi:hypothetical protein